MHTGFHLYTRNSMTALAEALAEARKANPRHFRGEGLLCTEEITVATGGVGTWLEHTLVQKAGQVVANTNFPFLNATIRNILDHNFKGRPGYLPDLFSREAMTWRLFGIFLHKQHAKESPLDAYLKDGDPLRAFQLANQLAQLFDQYICFLPDKLVNHQNTQDWQYRLWDQLCCGQDGAILSPAHAIMDFLKPDFTPKPQNPVTLFGISAMSEWYLRVFKRLAQNTRVNLFYHNLSDEFWGDLREKWQTIHDETTFCTPDSLKNDLLANCGMQGRNFFNAIVELDNVFEHDWNAGTTTTLPLTPPLLQRIQHSVVECNTPETQVLLDSDDSLTFHACWGDRRQVECLYDAVVHLIADGNCTLNDIIVMTPDIARFAPAIHAVFGGEGSIFAATDKGRARYVLADRSMRQTNQVAKGFLDLLDLYGTNLEASRILALLDSTPLRQKYGLDDESVSCIRDWLREVGIRRDSPDGIPAKGETEEYTWQRGLDRLLLTIATGDIGDTQDFAGIVPFAHAASGEQLRTLGALATLYADIRETLAGLATARTPAEWSRFLAECLDHCFDRDGEYADAHLAMRQAIFALQKSAADTGCAESLLPFSVVRAALDGAIDMHAAGAPFLGGRLTFCSMIPMRGIPCRVIAMLGLEDGSFPRQDDQSNFNLLRQSKLKYYDRSRPVEDRYLFLESLMAAKDHLLIYFNAHNELDGTDIQPASPVRELLDFAAVAASCEPRALIVQHPLNRWDAAVFRAKSDATRDLRHPFSYDAQAAAFAKHLRALPARRFTPTELSPDDLAAAAPAPEAAPGPVAVNLDELAAFLKSPVQFYLNARFGHLPSTWRDKDPADFESYSIDTLTRRRQMESLFQVSLTFPDDLKTTEGTFAAANSLPFGTLGTQAIHEEVEEIKNLQKEKPDLVQAFLGRQTRRAEVPLDVPLAWEPHLPELPQPERRTGQKEYLNHIDEAEWPALPPMEGTIRVTLSGNIQLDHSGNQVIAFHPDEWKGKYQVPWLLQHLLHCATSGQPHDGFQLFTYRKKDNKSKKTLLKNDVIKAPALATDVAKEQLAKLLTLFFLGKRMPLPLFPSYAIKRSSTFDREQSTAYGDDLKNDDYGKLVFPESFKDLPHPWHKLAFALAFEAYYWLKKAQEDQKDAAKAAEKKLKEGKAAEKKLKEGKAAGKTTR